MEIKELKENLPKSKLRKVEHLLPKFLLDKTAVCKHQHGCFENVIKDALHNFLFGLGLTMLLRHIGLIASPQKLIRSLMKLSVVRDCSKFGLFLMVFNSLYKLVLCLMRRAGCHKDRLNAPIAGFISALSISFDSHKRRELFAVLTLSRCIETTCNFGEAQGVKVPHRVLVFWIIANTLLQASYAFESDLMNRGLAKYFSMMSQMDKNDKKLVQVWHRMWTDAKTTAF